MLKRGLSGSTDLWDWWKQAREGQPNVDRNITITLLDEERAAVWAWRFRNAFPVNYRVDPLDAAQRHRRRGADADLRFDGHRMTARSSPS